MACSIAPLGAGWVYGITGLFFIVAVMSELRLPAHGLTTAPKATKFSQEFVEGLHFVARDRLLGMLVLMSMLVPFFSFPAQQLLPIFAEDVFDQGASGLGFLAAMSGIGGLAGAIVSANMDRQPAKGKLMFIGGMLMAVFLCLFALAPTLVIAMVLLAVANIGQMLCQNTNNAVIQAKSPPELRGRVNSLMLMSFGLMPLGVLPITALADEIGVQYAVAMSSGGADRHPARAVHASSARCVTCASTPWRAPSSRPCRRQPWSPRARSAPKTPTACRAPTLTRL